MEISKMISVMQAFMGGKQIESSLNGVDWVICSNPVWDWVSYEYRVMPIDKKPKKQKYEALVYFDVGITDDGKHVYVDNSSHSFKALMMSKLKEKGLKHSRVLAYIGGTKVND